MCGSYLRCLSSSLEYIIAWPKEGCFLKSYSKAFQVFVLGALELGDVVLVFDRYFKESLKAYQRFLRQEADGVSRPYTLKPDMQCPPRNSILKVPANKAQLNKMLVDGVLDPEFYRMATSKGKTLTLAGVENFIIEISNGKRVDRKDIRCEHEEADPIIAQMAILASLEKKSVMNVTEDTDVFALLLHFYVTNDCKEPMYMKSPKSDKSDDRTVIDIRLTAKKHNELAKHILRVHALTGGDNIPALSGIGKKRALNTLTCFTNESKTKSKKSPNQIQAKRLRQGSSIPQSWLQLETSLLTWTMFYRQDHNSSLDAMALAMQHRVQP